MTRLRLPARPVPRRRFLGASALIGAGAAMTGGFPMPAIAQSAG